MIDFLKESTFAVNDVVNKSWEILYKNYRNIAGLCLVMFIVLWMSEFLSSFASKGISVLNVLILMVFIVLYFGLQLTLFKYILFTMNVEDGDEETFTHKFIVFLNRNALKLVIVIVFPLIFIFLMSIISNLLNINPLIVQVTTISIGIAIIAIVFWNQIKPFFSIIVEFWPSKTQLGNFFIAILCVCAVTIITFVAIAAILFPLVYAGVQSQNLVNIAVPIGALMALIVLIRISFFPFFIIYLNASPFKSIRFSLAVTRGNFTRLLLLIGLTLISYLVGGYFQAIGYYFLSLTISLVYFFIIIPLSSVAVTVAFKQMMDDYKGGADPDIIHNLI
jgi:hypothetical protein